MQLGSVRAIIIASAVSAFAGAFGAGAALMLIAPDPDGDRALPVPASTAQIDRAVEALAPVCRLAAQRSLRRALDQSRRAWISTEDLDRLLGPLARGGAATCETINDQRFGLGGV